MQKFEMLPVDKVNLDISNPRIARLMEKYENPSAEQINLALGAGDNSSDSGTTFYSLKESIRTNKGLINPIIVLRETDGELVVIEGNTRLAIYRDFNDQDPSGNWSTIPSLVQDFDEIGSKGVEAIRLQAHLVGPRQWDPYSKAKYLNMLRNCEHLTMNEIIDFCGGRKTEVTQYIQAYEDMEKYYRPILNQPEEFDPTRFSAFVELQKSITKKSIFDAGYDITEFSKWVDDRLIDPLYTVRSLPAILSNEDAKKEFLKNGAKEAIKLIEKPDSSSEIAKADMSQLVKELTKRLRKIEYGTVKELSQNLDREDTRSLLDLSDELVNICNSINKGIE